VHVEQAYRPTVVGNGAGRVVVLKVGSDLWVLRCDFQVVASCLGGCHGWFPSAMRAGWCCWDIMGWCWHWKQSGRLPRMVGYDHG
jgi:hypothetical protein